MSAWNRRGSRLNQASKPSSFLVLSRSNDAARVSFNRLVLIKLRLKLLQTALACCRKKLNPGESCQGLFSRRTLTGCGWAAWRKLGRGLPFRANELQPSTDERSGAMGARADPLRQGLYVFASEFAAVTPGWNVPLGRSIPAADARGFRSPQAASLDVRRRQRHRARGKSRRRGAESLHPGCWSLHSCDRQGQPAARMVV